MKRSVFKRVELKYLLTKEQKHAFSQAIKDHIQPDEYGSYTICNLYMDTPDDILIRRSIEKPVYKEKMRVRSYGKVHDKNSVFIELKKKYEGIVYKRRINMHLDEALGYLDGEAARNGQIVDEIDYFIEHYTGLSPAMYISYDREAFTSTIDPTLRITFDTNILWRDQDLSLSSEIYGNTIIEDDEFLLEIKCADAMPLWLTKALSENKIYKTSFSKYGKAYVQKTSINIKSKRMGEEACQLH